MGQYLSNSVGYGLMIPYTDDEYDGDPPKEWENLVEKHDGDTYEVFQDLLEGYKDLSYDMTYYMDYHGPAVIFVDELSAASGGFGVLQLTNKVLVRDTFEYDKQLLEISRTIGMPLQDSVDGLGIWSTVSYG